MCFRPAGSSVEIHCPHCDKVLPVIGNTILKKCPFCKEAFSDDDIQAMQAQMGGPAADAGAAAPGAPGAPSAPGAPKAPGAPSAPSAPKAANA